jgi:hypothetical protein
MAAQYNDCFATPNPALRVMNDTLQFEDEIPAAPDTLRMGAYSADVSGLYGDGEIAVESTWVDEPPRSLQMASVSMMIGAIACFAWGGALAYFTLAM